MAITLNARSRTITGRKVSQLRREGLIPAVLFGKGAASQDVAVTELEFSRIQRRVSPTTLLDVVVDTGAPVKALLHKVQTDPRSMKPLHLELHQIRMEDKLKVQVQVHVEGSAPAVTTHGGTLVVAHDTVEVRCSPDHLISMFHADVSGLASFDDHLRAGDLKMPEGVELLTDPDTILVSVSPPRVAEEEELPEVEEAAAEETAEPTV